MTHFRRRRKPCHRNSAQPTVAFIRPAHSEGCFRWNPGEIVIGHGRPGSNTLSLQQLNASLRLRGMPVRGRELCLLMSRVSLRIVLLSRSAFHRPLRMQ